MTNIEIILSILIFFLIIVNLFLLWSIGQILETLKFLLNNEIEKENGIKQAGI